jgi:hypothetical protein
MQMDAGLAMQAIGLSHIIQLYDTESINSRG